MSSEISSDTDGYRGYFEHLYMADPPSKQLPKAVVQVVTADPPVDETRITVTMTRLKSM